MTVVLCNRRKTRVSSGKSSKKWMIAAIAIIAIIAISLGSYYYLQLPATQPSKVILKFAYSQDISSLDPGIRYPPPGECIQRWVMEGLTDFDEQMNILPKLATSWETNDGQTWIFHLRQGVKFQDGTPFNSSAVKFNLDPTIIKAQAGWDTGARVKQLAFINRVEEVDEYTVRIICLYPFGPLLANLAHPAGLIVSPSAKIQWGIDFTNHIVGTGPFKFVESVTGERVVVDKNEAYWGGMPKIDEIISYPVVETATRVARIETGELDVVHDIPPLDANRLNANPNLNVYWYSSLRTHSIAMNNLRAPFNDVRVRQAMNYAVDMDAIISAVLQGAGTRQDSPAAPGTFGYYSAKDYDYNVTKAKELMEAAGYPNGVDKEFTLLYDLGYMNIKEVMTAIASYLSEIGIKVVPTIVESQTIYKITGTLNETLAPDMFLASWAPSNGDVDWIIRPLYFGVRGRYTTAYTDMFYSNAKVDELILKGMAEYDVTKRMQIYAECQGLIMEDSPCLWTYAPRMSVAVKNTEHNMTILPTGIYVFTADTWLGTD
jgi:ABC-type transport system substrate-binding protein